MNINTPFHVIDLDRLRKNLQSSIKSLREAANCNVLLALKGFSTPEILEGISDDIDGISASGAFEAILGRNTINKHVCTYSAAYKECDIETICQKSNSIIFNSMYQYLTYKKVAKKNNASCGIRINPEFSLLPNTSRANPCRPYSRLGIVYSQMPSIDNFGTEEIEGIHFHIMCNQYENDFEKSIDFIMKKYEPFFRKIKWLNIGGGQMYAQDDYKIEVAIKTINKLHENFDFDIFVEPSSGILVDCGYLVTTVIDIVKNKKDIVIVDSSAVCHMPDAVFNNWYHDIFNADEPNVYPYNYQISGCSCYAGDIFGDYSFEKPISIGQKIIFMDTGSYSMVKNNFFNGINFPSIVTYSKTEGLKLIKSYDYNSFLNNL